MSSFGDVMRAIHAKELIKDDFVLLSIDTVTNMDIQAAVAFHF
jgi:NDP-sugar pyrophosphorylase family protein